jgi:hypothetical protein
MSKPWHFCATKESLLNEFPFFFWFQEQEHGKSCRKPLTTYIPFWRALRSSEKNDVCTYVYVPFLDNLMCHVHCLSHPWSNYCNIWPEIQIMYCCITSTRSPSFCITAPQCESQNSWSAYLSDMIADISRWIPTPRPPWLQKHSNLRARDMAHSPGSWRQPWPANVTCAWSRRVCGINPVVGHVWYYVINRC